MLAIVTHDQIILWQFLLQFSSFSLDSNLHFFFSFWDVTRYCYIRLHIIFFIIVRDLLFLFFFFCSLNVTRSNITKFTKFVFYFKIWLEIILRNNEFIIYFARVIIKYIENWTKVWVTFSYLCESCNVLLAYFMYRDSLEKFYLRDDWNEKQIFWPWNWKNFAAGSFLSTSYDVLVWKITSVDKSLLFFRSFSSFLVLNWLSTCILRQKEKTFEVIPAQGVNIIHRRIVPKLNNNNKTGKLRVQDLETNLSRLVKGFPIS